MDPCPFVRIVIGGLAMKLPVSSKPAFSGIHPSSSPCFCKIKLKNFPPQFASVPLISQNDDQAPASPSACFNLNKQQFEKLLHKSVKIEIYTGRRGNTCGLSSGKLLGRVLVPLDVKTGEFYKTSVIQNGWVSICGGEKRSKTELHLNVRADPDPRFVFQFDGAPESSPQVFQVNDKSRQPVFTCKFSCRSSGEHHLRCRSSVSDPGSSKNWLTSLKSSNKDKPVNERKGWSITIHDLSGSPVAAASMVTPFVPSPGTDRVSESNPGAWLILRPGDGTWKPWGRLEAWREHGGGHLGYRFHLLPDADAAGTDTVTVANSTLSTKNGGKFAIDFGSESGSGSWSQLYRGFVMSATVEGGGRCNRPEVEVGVGHVSCAEDAAAFVALAAAVDLSVDACLPFSEKLRKELRRQRSLSFVV
ncbi:Cyclin-dependent kinase 5 activator 2 like [Actinidia chinensis var. chinensis]|uniref:Cyclin-dependent kinase 5 activator 2 like n=1 Tax=Actinidia chinensis var. chinensis TaxID=1590841 RepID=A0A2R6Q648_ACTCC|nr:Cyclin-dependent kinase 5 activator 2 like [Actinidia chinensis var. chinensis]